MFVNDKNIVLGTIFKNTKIYYNISVLIEDFFQTFLPSLIALKVKFFKFNTRNMNRKRLFQNIVYIQFSIVSQYYTNI